jgi:hypothetical protein
MNFRNSLFAPLLAVALLGIACSSSSGNKNGTGGAGGKATGTGGAVASDGAVGTGGSAGASAGTGGSGTVTDAGMDRAPGDGGQTSATMTFFVSSSKSMTGNLGGLTGADKRCQDLAVAVGRGAKTWHAYLSVEHDAGNGGNATNARDRIGSGPWINSKGVMVAANLTELHVRKGDADVFIDEIGGKIPGQWSGSPPTVEHDILTGSDKAGMVVAGKTCRDWTSAMPAPDIAVVGHTDGLGPNGVMMAPDGGTDYTPWNSVHDNAGCDNTAPRGGAGRLYCFATN